MVGLGIWVARRSLHLWMGELDARAIAQACSLKQPLMSDPPQCLGLQNITGLITHLMFPNAAPWFYDVYGQDAAQPNYEDYPGNPAGLVRVDRILGSEYRDSN